MSPKNTMEIWQSPYGPALVDREKGLVTGLSVQTCPKCGGTMGHVPVDLLSASLLNTIGRMRCLNCGYVEGLDEAKCWRCGQTKILFQCNMCKPCYNTKRNENNGKHSL